LNEYWNIITVFIPELLPLKDFKQNNPHHLYDCLNHTLRVIDNTEQNIVLRLAALFHDSGKPKTYSEDENHVGHFYGHPLVSKEIAKKVLRRLKYSNNIIGEVSHLVEFHDYPITLNEKSIKKMLNYIGIDSMDALFKLKRADILGQGVFKEQNLVNIELAQKMIDEVIKTGKCFSLKQLNINGGDLISIGIKEGEKIRLILNELLNLVLIEELPNNHDKLIEKAIEMAKEKR
jgi:tRNA nucleotidyltransferase (CCA-adding enzyme)